VKPEAIGLIRSVNEMNEVFALKRGGKKLSRRGVHGKKETDDIIGKFCKESLGFFLGEWSHEWKGGRRGSLDRSEKKQVYKWWPIKFFGKA